MTLNNVRSCVPLLLLPQQLTFIYLCNHRVFDTSRPIIAYSVFFSELIGVKSLGVFEIWVVSVLRWCRNHAALLKSVGYWQSCRVAELFVPHCKDLISDYKYSRLDGLAWILRDLGKSLVKIEPSGPEFHHPLFQLGYTFEVASLRGCYGISHVEKGECMSFKLSIRS